MKDYEAFPPMEVTSAKGSWIYRKDAPPLLDAISSWWCKSLGHGHPSIAKAVQSQMQSFEHVILANTTNEPIVELSEHLASIFPGLDKVFYGGDGSTAVEIALKMSHHAHLLKGEEKRCIFGALENGYHGESALTLAVSDLGLYKEPYRALAPQGEMLGPVPYVTGVDDAKWSDASEEWQLMLPKLESLEERLSAIIFEPVVQGANGMMIYSPDLLRRLRTWTAERGIHMIADEIMTGFGRTGQAMACHHAGIVPDFVCCSKGLTSGWLPLSVVMCSTETYELFYDDYESGKAFLHSNTYCGNALGVAAALATLKVYEEESTFEQAEKLQGRMMSRFQKIAAQTGALENVRGIGGLVAAELRPPKSVSPDRLGYRVYRESVQRGALLRPLGNTLYWFPPLNVKDDELDHLAEVTLASIGEVFRL
jgi:adenosylmethionine-8-amino-7-oxononanoate aminotransferase